MPIQYKIAFKVPILREKFEIIADEHGKDILLSEEDVAEMIETEELQVCFGFEGESIKVYMDGYRNRYKFLPVSVSTTARQVE